MAMVFMSEKKLIDKLPKNAEGRGPGEYIPQSQIKKYKTDKEPFLSTINGTFKKTNNFPGPGSYYRDDILINYLKNNQNAKILLKNIKSNPNEEKLGFNIKEKRFDILKKNNDPGPGYYFKITKNFKKKIKNNIHKTEFKKSDNLLQLIPTIPNKFQKYGFDILEDGKIIQKIDPFLSQTFSGEKGDSVGPGRYEISDEINWYKTGPQFSKQVRNCFISNNKINLSGIESTDQTDNSNNFNNNKNNSNFLSSITASKFIVDNNLNVIELSPCNISNNFNNINLDKYKLEKNDNDKKQKDYRLLINNVEKYKRILFKGTCKNFSTPGPGFYIDRFKNSCFQTKYVPENQQFFGTKTRRFMKNENKSCEDIFKIYDFDLYNNNNHEKKYSDSDLNRKLKKTKSLTNFAPFSTNEKRFIKFLDKDKSTNPSPFEYNLKSFLDNKKKSLSQENFGASEKKFTQKKEIEWKHSIPGPGYYDPDKPKKHVPAKKYQSNNFIDNKSLYNLKNENETENENERIDLYSIKFQNEKKLKNTNNKNVCFYRTNPRNKNIIGKSLSCGRLNERLNEYKNKIIDNELDINKKEIKQIYPPFNISGYRDNKWLYGPEYCQGPGQYKKDSYFDWNKKTYNKKFL